MHAGDMIVAQLFWLDREHLPDFYLCCSFEFFGWSDLGHVSFVA
jgi:hypothetical protein